MTDSIFEFTETMTTPRINFANFHGFSSNFEDGKINIEKFLVAAQEIIKIIETFGKVYKPVVIDMQGNHDKLKAYYKSLENPPQYLEDLILEDLKNSPNHTKLELLWLKR